ncbi:hypothetical protein HPB51_019432 [Rhipicephalus microplus]|uniref:Uncharacterized protein n=1 Tax=Rhipicephalus microplus TaxID=6941 RepID=A0A9J6EIU1_RHIMP|nr:hypothetical protein HPB51_019432 [Rhipicephalus microplus]
MFGTTNNSPASSPERLPRIDTPVHRSSPCLLGLSPEFGPVPESVIVPESMTAPGSTGPNMSSPSTTQTNSTQDAQENGDQATSTPRHDSGTPEPKHPSDKQFRSQWKEDIPSQGTSRISEDIEHTVELAEEGNPGTQVGKKGRPLKSENTSQKQQQLSADHKQKHPYPQTQSNDHPPQSKRTVVLGDSNAHRLKKHLRKAIHDQRLRITTKSGANLEETLHRAEGEIQKANATNTELQLIIHVGTTDLLNKADIKKTTDHLKQQLTYWSQKTPKHHYIVSAIPEPKARGQQFATACQTWNTAVQTACTALGPSVRFMSAAAQLTADHLDDIHYSEQAADQVGSQLDDPVDTRVEHTESAKRRLKLWDRLCWQVDKHPDSVQRNEGPTENI